MDLTTKDIYMSLRDRILSDINIYAAIHALPNTLKEKSLICGDHQQYLKDLREIYRYGASHDKFMVTSIKWLTYHLRMAGLLYYQKGMA